VNAEKLKYIIMSRCLNAGQKLSIKMANRSFEDGANFKYLGTSLRDQNYMHEQIKSRLNLGNVCCHSAHSFLSSRLLP
jgi:hypothetical protein